MRKLNHNGEIKIESEIMNKLGLKEGDVLEQHVVKGDMVLIKKVNKTHIDSKIDHFIDLLHQLKEQELTTSISSLICELEEEINHFQLNLEDKYDIEEFTGERLTSLDSEPQERELFIIKTIGDGINSFSDIGKKTNIPKSSLSEILQNMVERGLVDYNKIHSGGRGRPSHTYYLTPVGQEFFQLNC